MLRKKYDSIVIGETHFVNKLGKVEKIIDKRELNDKCEKVRLNGIYYTFSQVQLFKLDKEIEK